MTTLSILPASHDVDFILEKMKTAGVLNHYGYSRNDDGIHLRYRAEDFDTVQAILDDYPVSYADEVLRPSMLNAATQLRWTKQQQPITLNGMTVPTDDTTINRITAASYLMAAVPTSPQTRRWKVNDNLWLDLDRTMLLQMGEAIANHIQSCFAQEEQLHTEIKAATNVDQLLEIDMTAGWPV